MLRSSCFSARTLSLRGTLLRCYIPRPFAGGRMLRDFPRMAGHPVGRLKGRTLMKKAGVEAIARKPDYFSLVGMLAGTFVSLNVGSGLVNIEGIADGCLLAVRLAPAGLARLPWLPKRMETSVQAWYPGAE